MTNLFDDEPDGRQSTDLEMQTSRFRPRYRALTEAEKKLHDDIKELAEEVEQAFQQIEILREMEGRATDGRYIALAITDLERSIMWAIKGLTA